MKQEKENSTIIDNPRKLIIPDASGNGNHITMVINWSPFIKNCEYIKLIMPNGDSCIVQKDEFRSLLTMIATEEEAELMGRQKIRTIRMVRGAVPVTWKKDTLIKAGTTHWIPYVHPLKVPLEVLEEEDDKGVIKAR